MKKIITSVFVILSALTACTVQNQGQSYDEVYYNPKDGSSFVQTKSPLLHKKAKETVIKTDSTVPSNAYVGNAISNPQGYKAQKDSGAYVDNSFNYDDYYDYSYASRIRRFQYSPFSDYYNDYYTNRYWYDYNPAYWGSSIYNNWGFGMSYFMSPFSFRWGMYSPFYNYYDPFYYDPFYYGYSPFSLNSYWWGYNNGYYNGYYNGLYGYGNGGGGIYGYTGGYNNSLDKNSRIYYGPRRDGAGTNGPIPSERTAFSQRYNGLNGLTNGGGSAVNGPSTGRQIMSSNGAAGSTATPNLRDKVAATNQNVTGRTLRDAGNGNLFGSTPSNSQRVPGQGQIMSRQNLNRYVSDQVREQQVTGRGQDARSVQQQGGSFKDRAVINGNQQYTRPNQGAATQQYYNPANARPRSSNEYTSPGYRNPAIYNSQQYTPQQRSVSDPSRYAPVRTYSAPASSGSGYRPTGGYSNYRQESSAPSTYRSSAPSSYSAPTQSYSAPSQSYSAPSSSGRSEAPSSSSGSSSSSSGGGVVNSPRR